MPSSSVLVAGKSSYFTKKHLDAIRDRPEILGHMVGKNKLTAIHGEWIKYIWDSGHSRALQAHRGSYKTTAIGAIGIVRWLLFYPDSRIGLIRKTYADAADVVATVAKIFEDPEIRELFYYAHGEYPDFRMRREGRIEMTFKKTQTPEGSLTGLGINSPMTGKHFDFILCDDVSGLKDRLSKAEREYTKNIVREIQTNIVDRGRPCCFIGTPWHPEDAFSITVKPVRFSIDDCGLISEVEQAELRAGTTASLYAANYELKFVSSEDAPFKDPLWGKWETRGIEAPRASIDSAYGGGDFCALTIGARRHTGDIQTVGFASKDNIKDWLPVIEQKMRHYSCKKIYVEQNSDKGWTASMLRQRGFSVVEYAESTKKQHKIITYLGELWPRLVWADETDGEYLSQIVDWTPETREHDDAPDSASILMRACYSKKGSHTERWRD